MLKPARMQHSGGWNRRQPVRKLILVQQVKRPAHMPKAGRQQLAARFSRIARERLTFYHSHAEPREP